MNNIILSRAKKWLISLSCLTILSSGQASTSLPGYLISKKQVGFISHPSELANQLVDSNNWLQVPIYKESDLSSLNLVIINLAEYNNNEAVNIAKRAFRLGKTLILDSSQAINDEKIAEINSKIIGIGLADPIVVVRRENNVPEYKSLSISSELTSDERANRLIKETQTVRLLKKN